MEFFEIFRAPFSFIDCLYRFAFWYKTDMEVIPYFSRITRPCSGILKEVSLIPHSNLAKIKFLIMKTKVTYLICAVMTSWIVCVVLIVIAG